MINDYMTKLPFFVLKGTVQVKDMVFWQRNRTVCADMIKPVLTPNDFWPEFIFKRPISLDAPVGFAIYRLQEGELVYQTFILTSALISCDVNDGLETYNTITFNGALGADLNCGTQYCYVVEFADGTKYYSELFEATGFPFSKLPSKYSLITYTSTCANQGIPYSINGLLHRLWIPAEPLHTEIETNIETTEDNNGEVLSSSETIEKKHKLVIGQAASNLYDALSSILHYVKDAKCSVEFGFGNNQESAYMRKVSSFDLDKPDYGTDECMPVVRFSVSIQDQNREVGCCDDTPVCFDGQSFGIPELTIVSGNRIKFKYAQDLEPVQECFAVCEWKTVAAATWQTQTILRSGLTDAGFTTPVLTSGNYQCRISFRPSQPNCQSNLSLTQEITIP